MLLIRFPHWHERMAAEAAAGEADDVADDGVVGAGDVTGEGKAEVEGTKSLMMMKSHDEITEDPKNNPKE